MDFANLQGAIHRDPGPDFGIHKMFFLGAHLPDSAVRFSPHFFERFNHGLDEVLEHFSLEARSVLVREIKCVKQNAVNIQLKLIPRSISYANGSGFLVSL